jgi:CRP-like cAMP-binding protein
VLLGIIIKGLTQRMMTFGKVGEVNTTTSSGLGVDVQGNTGMVGVERLKKIGPLSDLTSDELEGISQICGVRTYEPAAIIFKEGDEGKEMYVVDKGMVSCIVHPKPRQSIIISTRTRNSLLGWAAILPPYRHAVTTRSEEKTRVFAIKSEQLGRMWEAHPNIRDIVMQHIVTGERLRETELFDCLTPYEAELASLACETRVYKKGDTIFKEGDESTEIFVVDEGEVQCALEPRPNQSLVVDTLTKDQLFGWSAIAPPHRRTATIQATKKTRVFVVRTNDLRRVREVNPVIWNKVLAKIVRIVDDRLGKTRRALAQAFWEC